MLELLGVVGVGGENCVEVASVVGIELALNECLWSHAGVV